MYSMFVLYAKVLLCKLSAPTMALLCLYCELCVLICMWFSMQNRCPNVVSSPGGRSHPVFCPIRFHGQCSLILQCASLCCSSCSSWLHCLGKDRSVHFDLYPNISALTLNLLTSLMSHSWKREYVRPLFCRPTYNVTAIAKENKNSDSSLIISTV